MKIPVSDLHRVRKRLEELGGVRAEIRFERDIYFNAPDRDFGDTDEALRIREAGSECTLTYKGPKIGIHAIKAREEYTVGLDSIGAMERILERLGLRRVVEVRKVREVYRFRGVTVSLDEVEELGSYVEIETIVSGDAESAAELLGNIKRELRIEGESTTLSYLEILLAKRSEARS